VLYMPGIRPWQFSSELRSVGGHGRTRCGIAYSSRVNYTCPKHYYACFKADWCVSMAVQLTEDQVRLRLSCGHGTASGTASKRRNA